MPQERIDTLFASDSGRRTVARDDHRVVREREELVVDGAEDLAAVPAWQIRSSDAVAKQSVACQKLILHGNPQAGASLRVAGRVQRVQLGRAQTQRIAVVQGVIDLCS